MTMPVQSSINWSLAIKRGGAHSPNATSSQGSWLYSSECILQNKEPEPSGLEGLADVRIVNAIYESVRTNKPVRIEAIESKPRPSLAQDRFTGLQS